MELRPLHDRIIVRRDKEGEQQRGGRICSPSRAMEQVIDCPNQRDESSDRCVARLNSACHRPGSMGTRQPMVSTVKRFLVQDDGQDLIEYALLAAFIALAAVAAVTQLGTAVNNIYTRISSSLDTAGGGS